MNRTQIVLISKEGKTFKLNRTACTASKFLQNILEDKECKEITFEKVDSKTLDSVCQYLTYHEKVPPIIVQKPLRSCNMAELVDAWDAKFCDVDQDTMFARMLCANYMAIESMLNLMCAKCASTLVGKSQKQIMEYYNIDPIYTPEEEEQVRRDNADLFD